MPRTSTLLLGNHSKNTSSHVLNPIIYIPFRNMSTGKPTNNISIKEKLQDFIDFILSDPLVNFVCAIVVVTYYLIYANQQNVEHELGGDFTAKKPNKDS